MRTLEIASRGARITVRNGLLAILIVLLVLALFLEYRLAFWVMMGMSIAFIGSLLFLPVIGVSINMIAMFGFLVALGIVVDDAIVVGENVYSYRQEGMGALEAAIVGAREMARPVTFAILTNIAIVFFQDLVPKQMGLAALHAQPSSHAAGLIAERLHRALDEGPRLGRHHVRIVEIARHGCRRYPRFLCYILERGHPRATGGRAVPPTVCKRLHHHDRHAPAGCQGTCGRGVPHPVVRRECPHQKTMNSAASR